MEFHFQPSHQSNGPIRELTPPSPLGHDNRLLTPVRAGGMRVVVHGVAQLTTCAIYVSFDYFRRDYKSGCVRVG